MNGGAIADVVLFVISEMIGEGRSGGKHTTS
jgi:hypothetical protein